MATNKTIQPTNVTVQIPAMTDVPDMSVPANAIDKTIDAVNVMGGFTTMTNGTELNSLTAKANYMVGNIAQMGHAPTGCGSSGFFYVDKNSSYILQKFFGNLGSAHRFSYDSGSNWTNWFDPNSQFGKSRILSYGNVSSISVDLGYTPTTSHYGTILMFNGNQSVMAIINIGSTISVTTISGNATITASASGSTLTISSNNTLWGCTTIIVGEYGS